MTLEPIPLFKVLMAPEAPARVAAVLTSGHIAQGPEVDQFEAELARALEVPTDRVVTVNSGTSALHLAYVMAGISAGSRVIVSPMTCAATITPLVQMGAKIIWADVDPLTGNISPTDVACIVDSLRDVAEMPSAIIGIDWAGRSADYTALAAIHPHVPIIEDAAHAFGAAPAKNGLTIAHAAIHTGVLACFSFQAIKHLTCGDGGAIVCPTPQIARRAKVLRWFGLDRTSSKDFRCEQEIREAGFKYHMNDIAAAIGRANLPHAVAAVEVHRANARQLWKDLSGFAPRVELPPWDPDSAHWIFTVLVDDRRSFQAFLADRGIASSQVHRRNDHQPAFPTSWPRPLPGLEQFSARQVAIPCGWWMTVGDVSRVIDAVRAWARA